MGSYLETRIPGALSNYVPNYLVHETVTDLSVLDEETKKIWVQDSTERYWYLPKHYLNTAREDRALFIDHQRSFEGKEP